MKEVTPAGRGRLHVQASAQRIASGVSLLGTILVTEALFPPFVKQACPGCSAFYAAGIPTGTLRVSPDAWAVIWIVAVLAVTSALVLAGRAKRLMTMLNALASLAALGLALFEGAVAFPRVVSVGELVPNVPLSYDLGPGYYLFLVGAIVAVGAAAAMVLIDRFGHTANLHPTRRWVAATLGAMCLGSLFVALAGAFLPFAEANCGFGCPPGLDPVSGSVVVSPGVYSDTLAGSSDGKIAIALLVTAGVAIALCIARRITLMTSSVALACTFAATVLVSFDSLNAGQRVLEWWFAMPTSAQPGYYLLQVGSAVGVVLSLLLVTGINQTWKPHRQSGITASRAVPQE